MRSIPPRTLKRIQRFLEDHGQVSYAAAICEALRPKKAAKPAEKRRALKKRTRKEKTSAVREAVMARADNACESCGLFPLIGNCLLELDHFRSGAHKRSNETVEGCWAICHTCHFSKTNNRPSRIHWLHRFREHCRKLGYTREARETERLIDSLNLQDQIGRAG